MRRVKTLEVQKGCERLWLRGGTGRRLRGQGEGALHLF